MALCCCQCTLYSPPEVEKGGVFLWIKLQEYTHKHIHIKYTVYTQGYHWNIHDYSTQLNIYSSVGGVKKQDQARS